MLMRCYFSLHWNLKWVFSVACRKISRFPIVLYFLRVYRQKYSYFLLQLILMYCILFFLYSSLSIWSLDFLNFLKSLSLVFIFSKTSLSNHFWAFALTLLVLKGTTLSTTNNYPYFLKKFEYASLTSLNSL